METRKRFDQLGLGEKTLEAIKLKGFEEPTAIQEMTIPRMLQGENDIIAQAQTGTGKTAAFGLPLIELSDPKKRTVQALILVPTRELAIQVSEEIHSLKGKSPLDVIPIYGGQSIDQQLRRLRRGVQIVVGTPGRIIDHLKRKSLNLEDVKHLILDEADEMLNMGFIEDMEEIMSYTGLDKRTLLFSATMPPRIAELAKKYMIGYELLSAGKEGLTTALTEQIYYEVKASDKFEALCRIIDIEEVFYGLVFCRTKIDVDHVASHLIDRGYDAEAIHGDISQAQRERTLDRFRKRSITILVATDVAARGIDVNDLTHVINYSLPQDPESYVHRIGRTGRAGKEGTAITFITPSEYRKLMIIRRVAGSDIKKSQVPTVKEIIKAKKRKVYEDIAGMLESDMERAYLRWADKLLEEREPRNVVAALLDYSFRDDMDTSSYSDIKEPERGKPRGRNELRQIDRDGKTRLFVALGKKDGMHPGKLVKMVLEKIDISPRLITDIQVMESFSFMTVPFNKAEALMDEFRKGRGKPLITRAKGERGGKGKR